MSDEKLGHRLHLATKDMADARSYLEAIEALESLQGQIPAPHFEHAVEGLRLAAIVAYARPFTTSHSNGQADKLLDVRAMQLFQNSPSHLHQFHQELLDRRNSAAAHADWSHHSTKLFGSSTSPSATVRKATRPDFVTGLPIANFLALVCWLEAVLRRLTHESDLRTLSGERAAGGPPRASLP